jgi:hypothetical protein
MLIKAGNREDAIHALINTWLKDTTLRCGWCGQRYYKYLMPCCEKPFIGTNLDIFQQFYTQLKEDRDTRRNEFASTKCKTMRWKLSFPPGLLEWLDKSFETTYSEKLFNEKYTANWFARKFKKYFTVPERI